jgi:hypothetical protein
MEHAPVPAPSQRSPFGSALASAVGDLAASVFEVPLATGGSGGWGLLGAAGSGADAAGGDRVSGATGGGGTGAVGRSAADDEPPGTKEPAVGLNEKLAAPGLRDGGFAPGWNTTSSVSCCSQESAMTTFIIFLILYHKAAGAIGHGNHREMERKIFDGGRRQIP